MSQSTLSVLRKKWSNLFSIVRWVDIKDLFLILLSCPVGLILRLFHKNIWIVSEMEHTARDNGYWFFKYLREQHPDWPVYYPIQFTAADYPKVKVLGNVIRHGSFKHHVYTWAAAVDISARTGRGLPARLMSHLFQKKGLYLFKTVFLQHGVIKESPDFLQKELNNIDYFVATTQPEADEIHTGLHYDKEQILVTGMPRYDNLNEFTVNPKQILLMPTWRTGSTSTSSLSCILSGGTLPMPRTRRKPPSAQPLPCWPAAGCTVWVQHCTPSTGRLPLRSRQSWRGSSPPRSNTMRRIFTPFGMSCIFE